MNNYAYISTRKDKEKYIIENFPNTIFIKMNPGKNKLKKLMKKLISDKITIVIIEDYFIGVEEFIKLLNHLGFTVKVVWTSGLAVLNEEIILGYLNLYLDLLEDDKLYEMAFSEENMYKAFKDFKHIERVYLTYSGGSYFVLDINETISVLAETHKWRCNLFNQLSAVKLLDGYSVSGYKIDRLFKKFARLFKIKYKNYNNREKFIESGTVMCCVEFASALTFEIFDAYNNGIPCVMGNNISIFKGTDLEDVVVVKSCDDINEIAEKLKYCTTHKTEILLEYQEIKKEYDRKSRRSIEYLLRVPVWRG